MINYFIVLKNCSTPICKGRHIPFLLIKEGYKWDTKDIERLLKDINEFSPNEDLNLFYCLQNITLVESLDSKTFNVVDGQQRLTTLTVILSYLNEYELINEKLQYNVRKETEEFLKEYTKVSQVNKYQLACL